MSAAGVLGVLSIFFLFHPSASSSTQVTGFKILKETPDSLELELEYELDDRGEEVFIQTQGMLSRPERASPYGYRSISSACCLSTGESGGFFGFTPGLAAPGRNKTRTSVSIYGELAPARFTTRELEFSFYPRGGSPFAANRLPHVKKWVKREAPLLKDTPVVLGGTELGQRMGNFRLRDSNGRMRSFKSLAPGVKAFLYCIQTWGKIYEKQTEKLEPLIRELEASGVAVIGLHYLGGTKDGQASGSPAKVFGTVLLDPTGIVCYTYGLQGSGSGVMAVDEAGLIAFKGPIGRDPDPILGALGIGLAAWPYRPEKKRAKR